MSTNGENDEKSEEFMKTVPSFDFTNSSTKHDTVLIVEETKFYVTSGLLSTWSEYFEGLFGPGFKDANVKEIEIKEVAAEDFKEFLQFIYPSRAKVDEKNVIGLIKMAYRFLAPGVMVECQKFIDESFDEIDIFELLEISIKFSMTELKEQIGCFIYASPAKGSGHDRCNSCKFCSDDDCCQHDDRGSEIMVNSFIDEHFDRIMNLSNEAKLFVLLSPTGNYDNLDE